MFAVPEAHKLYSSTTRAVTVALVRDLPRAPPPSSSAPAPLVQCRSSIVRDLPARRVPEALLAALDGLVRGEVRRLPGPGRGRQRGHEEGREAPACESQQPLVIAFAYGWELRVSLTAVVSMEPHGRVRQLGRGVVDGRAGEGSVDLIC